MDRRTFGYLLFYITCPWLVRSMNHEVQMSALLVKGLQGSAEFEEPVTVVYNRTHRELDLGFRAFDSWWQFKLWRNDILVSRYTSVGLYDIEGQLLSSDRHQSSDCHYIGTGQVGAFEGGTIAISLCDKDVRGYVLTNRDSFEITSPTKHRKRKRRSADHVYKRKDDRGRATKRRHTIRFEPLPHPLGTTLYLELGIIIDANYVRTFETKMSTSRVDLYRYVLRLINSAQLWYVHPTLGYQVWLTVRDIVVMDDDLDVAYGNRTKERINAVCKYVGERIKIGKRWDASVIFTQDELIREGLAGLALPGVGCEDSTHHCVAVGNYDFDFDGHVRVLTHELGHAIGMPDDYTFPTSDVCFTGMMRAHFDQEWSRCSVQHLEKWLNVEGKDCAQRSNSPSLKHQRRPLVPLNSAWRANVGSSSTANDDQVGWGAWKAVDGSIFAQWHTGISAALGSCAKTKLEDQPWLIVELPEHARDVNVEYIYIHTADIGGPLRDFEVRIGKSKYFRRNDVCAFHAGVIDGNSYSKMAIIKCRKKMKGRYVSVQSLRNNVTLSICEIFIYQRLLAHDYFNDFNCADKFKFCHAFVHICHKVDVQKLCPLSCGQCHQSIGRHQPTTTILQGDLGKCMDYSPRCKRWKHLCKTSPKILRRCPQTCQKCVAKDTGKKHLPDRDVTGIVCRDYNRQFCRKPRARSHCHKKTVRRTCPRTCGLCTPKTTAAPPTTQPTTTTTTVATTTEPTTRRPVLSGTTQKIETTTLPPTETPTALPTTPGLCRDSRHECYSWAKAGYCSYLPHVRERCPLSCEVCEYLVNTKPTTPFRSSTTAQPTTTEPLPTTMNLPCEDQNDYCRDWEESGYCQYYDHIRPVCRLSCGLCTVEPTTSRMKPTTKSTTPPTTFRSSTMEWRTTTDVPPTTTVIPPTSALPPTTERPTTTETIFTTPSERPTTRKQTESTTERLAPLPTDGDCYDDDSQCEEWSEIGYCYYYPHILADCRKSCNVCISVDYQPEEMGPTRDPTSETEKCFDAYSDCSGWTNNGYCVFDHIRESCLLSCRLCGPNKIQPTPGATGEGTLTTIPTFSADQCFDYYTECPGWSKIGYCEAFRHVRSYCPVSCDVCRARVPTTTVAPIVLSAEDKCYDDYSECGAWSAIGYCDVFLQLRHNCRRSCDTCEDPFRHLFTTTTQKPTTTTVSMEIPPHKCFDQYTECKSWSRQGECWRESVWQYCYESCQVCSTEGADEVDLPGMNDIDDRGFIVLDKDAKCYDERDECPNWASFGYCEMYPHISRECRQSCGECGKLKRKKDKEKKRKEVTTTTVRAVTTVPDGKDADGCVDYEDSCGGWARAGYCEEYPHILWQCRLSCEVCRPQRRATTQIYAAPTSTPFVTEASSTPGETTVDMCIDQSYECEMWAAVGYCEIYPHIVGDCSKSCRACAGDTTTIATTSTKSTTTRRATTQSTSSNAPAATEAAVKCRDDNMLCQGWSWVGYCASLPHIRPICRLSCGLCRPATTDVYYSTERYNNGYHTSTTASHRENKEEEDIQDNSSLTTAAFTPTEPMVETTTQTMFPAIDEETKVSTVDVIEVEEKECIDDHSDCLDWARHGLCLSEPWIKSECRESCRVCNTESMNKVPVKKNGRKRKIKRVECRDDHKNCVGWSKAGHCDLTPWIKGDCPLSCGICTVEQCVDSRAECPGWASADYCRQAPHVRRDCPLSCNLCGYTTTAPMIATTMTQTLTTIECRDKNVKCSEWKHRGYCAMMVYVRRRCRLTCEICDGSIIPPTPVPTTQQPTTVPTVVTTIPEPCEDDTRSCITWMSRGYCDVMPHIRPMCRLSCGICRPEISTPLAYASSDTCFDTNPLCLIWAKRGLCRLLPYLIENCRLSCGLCKVTTQVMTTPTPTPFPSTEQMTTAIESTTAAGCIDLLWDCADWGQRGYCSHSPYVQENCGHTCKLCGPDSDRKEIVDYPAEPVTGCVDYRSECGEWAIPQYCRFSTMIREDCPRSCGLCADAESDYANADDPPCADELETCPGWAEAGYCRQAHHVAMQCKLSCGLCEGRSNPSDSQPSEP